MLLRARPGSGEEWKCLHGTKIFSKKEKLFHWPPFSDTAVSHSPVCPGGGQETGDYGIQQ